MTRTIISPSDLSQRTGEILDRVREGELAVVASGGRSWASPQPMPMTWASSRRWAGSSWGEWGGVPKTGDHFERAGWSFEVIDMDDRRVDRGARGRNDRPARLPRGRVGIVDQQQPAVIGIADPGLVAVVGCDAVGAAGGLDGRQGCGVVGVLSRPGAVGVGLVEVATCKAAGDGAQDHGDASDSRLVE